MNISKNIFDTLSNVIARDGGDSSTHPPLVSSLRPSIVPQPNTRVQGNKHVCVIWTMRVSVWIVSRHDAPQSTRPVRYVSVSVHSYDVPDDPSHHHRRRMWTWSSVQRIGSTNSVPTIGWSRTFPKHVSESVIPNIDNSDSYNDTLSSWWVGRPWGWGAYTTSKGGVPARRESEHFVVYVSIGHTISIVITKWNEIWVIQSICYKTNRSVPTWLLYGRNPVIVYWVVMVGGRRMLMLMMMRMWWSSCWWKPSTWSRTGRCGGDDWGGCPVCVESDQGNVVVVVVVATEGRGRYDGRVV